MKRFAFFATKKRRVMKDGGAMEDEWKRWRQTRAKQLIENMVVVPSFVKSPPFLQRPKPDNLIRRRLLNLSGGCKNSYR